MKQVVTMVVCILLIILGGICEVKYLNKSSLYLRSELEYIKNAVENDNYDIANNQANKTYESWQKMKDIWGVFINHEEIDDIDEFMVELKKNIEFENSDESLISIEQIDRGLEHTVQRQNLKIDNVL